MDQKAKEAGLDEVQWNNLVKKSLAFKEMIGGTLTILHTIEPNKLFVRLDMKDAPSRIMELTTSQDCIDEFKKCNVFAMTVFEKVL